MWLPIFRALEEVQILKQFILHRYKKIIKIGGWRGATCCLWFLGGSVNKNMIVHQYGGPWAKLLGAVIL